MTIQCDAGYFFFSLNFFFFRFIITFANTTLAKCPDTGKSKCRDIYIKGVTVRFGFDVLESRKFKWISQEQSNGDALWGAYTVCPKHFLYPHVMGKCSGMLDIYIIVGLSALLVSTDRAMREPQDVKRATGWLHVFLYMHVSS